MAKHRNSILLIYILVVFIAITGGYISCNYEWKSEKVELIELHINKSYREVLPFVYITDKNDANFDLSKPFSAYSAFCITAAP